jgi:thioredoxin-like negative regulator of GroEL
MSDLESPLWDTFDVRIVPTVVVFKEGRPIFRSDGVLGRGLPTEVMDEVVHEVSVGQPAVAH